MSRRNKQPVSKTLFDPIYWISTFLYHLASFLFLLVIPNQTVGELNKGFFPESFRQSTPIIYTHVAEILIYDAFGLAILFSVAKTYKRYFNLVAIFSIIVVNNLVFYALLWLAQTILFS